MNKPSSNAQMTGMFQLSENRRLPGTLSLDGPNTTLHLWDEAIHLWDKATLRDEPQYKTITGVLDDRKLVTLIGCIPKKTSINVGPGGAVRHHHIFPHHVVIGDRRISEDGADIENISYIFEDAPTLFRDMESFKIGFGSAENARTIIQSFNPEKEIHVGEGACVAYYTGKEEIFSSDTVLGWITVRHSPTIGFGGPEGIRIDNRIVAKIDFPQPLVFQEAVSRMCRSVSFFGLIVGRLQNLRGISISWRGDDLPIICDVHMTMYPRYEYPTNGFGSSSHNVLVDGAKNAPLLSSVAKAWLQRDGSWRTARGMLLSGWKENRSYGANRLVSAANMYDLLPKSTFPQGPEVNDDLALSVRKAKEMFLALPNGTDRDSVLAALGRVGTLTLKKKIGFRAEVISKLLEDKVPDIKKVAEEAVNLRNQYVHGSSTRIDYGQNPHLKNFLTDTLEFVFAASDLIDAGWNIRNWIERESDLYHPFGRYIKSYRANLKELKRLIDGGCVPPFD